LEGDFNDPVLLGSNSKSMQMQQDEVELFLYGNLKRALFITNDGLVVSLKYILWFQDSSSDPYMESSLQAINNSVSGYSPHS
jgi:hypothetical protein